MVVSVLLQERSLRTGPATSTAATTGPATNGALNSERKRRHGSARSTDRMELG